MEIRTRPISRKKCLIFNVIKHTGKVLEGHGPRCTAASVPPLAASGGGRGHELPRRAMNRTIAIRH